MKTRYLSMIMLIALGLFSCEKESDSNSSSSSSSSNNNNGSSTSLAGTYTGKQIEVYTDQANGNVIGSDTTDNQVFVISGSGSSYTMSYDDGTTTHSINLSYSNNTISGTGSSDPNDYFEGETYSGSLSGDQLTLNYTGVWDDSAGTIYNYTGNYVGNRPPTTGGGSGGGTSGDYLSVSSSSAGAKLRANCDGDFDAAFVGTTSGEEWLLSLFHFNTCADKLGTLTVNSGANSVNEISLELWLVDVNGDPMITLDSEDNSGTMTVSQVGTKMKYEATNLTLDDGSGNNYTVSFRVTEI